MNRLLAPFLLLIPLGIAVGAAPASAYCIKNETSRVIDVELKTYSPLGKFKRTIAPGRKACCDWFDRRCNPTGTRQALVSLGVESAIIRTKKKQKKIIRSLEPEDIGNVYNQYGRRFDAYGEFLRSKRPRARKSRNKNDGKFLANLEPAPVADPTDYFCSHGRLREVKATGAGTVTVWSDSLRPGKLRCDSRDYFLRPVQTDTPATTMGLPLLHMPAAPVRPNQHRETTKPGE